MKFTIGLPVIKIAYLQETLDGIKNQSFKDFELIIKNNASTDDVKNKIRHMCNEWIEKDNVKYFESNKQLRMTENFNSILDKASGDYFTIMSDDDIMEPDYLSEFNSLTNKYPEVNVFHCRVKRIDGNGILLDYSELCPEWESQIDFIYQRLKSKRTLYLSDFVVKTAKLKEINGFPSGSSGWGCDEITWSKLSSTGFAYSPKILLKYRRFIGNFSLSKQNLAKRFKDIELMNEELKSIILKNTENENCIYPNKYLMDLLKKYIQKQNDYVLEHYAKSTNIFELVNFYGVNKNNISYKGLLKAMTFKTIYGKEFEKKI
jgi:glycosyltransferase involved in cell wall biosynthesis